MVTILGQALFLKLVPYILDIAPYGELYSTNMTILSAFKNTV
jgi:hypothetical protein